MIPISYPCANLVRKAHRCRDARGASRDHEVHARRGPDSAGCLITLGIGVIAQQETKCDDAVFDELVDHLDQLESQSRAELHELKFDKSARAHQGREGDVVECVEEIGKCQGARGHRC